MVSEVVQANGAKRKVFIGCHAPFYLRVIFVHARVSSTLSYVRPGTAVRRIIHVDTNFNASTERESAASRESRTVADCLRSYRNGPAVLPGFERS